MRFPCVISAQTRLSARGAAGLCSGSFQSVSVGVSSVTPPHILTRTRPFTGESYLCAALSDSHQPDLPITHPAISFTNIPFNSNSTLTAADMSDISNDEQGWWQRLADLLESDEGRKRIVAMFTDSHEGSDRYLLDHMSGSYDAKQGQRLAELFGSDDGRQELVEMFFRSRDGGADLLTLISSRLQEKYQDAPPLTLSNAVSWPGFWDRGFGERIRRRSRDDLALSE